jgi:hypothetical protein
VSAAQQSLDVMDTPHWHPGAPLFRPLAMSNLAMTGAITEELEMLPRVFALTAVIGLLVTGSAAFVANHPHAARACASTCD